MPSRAPTVRMDTWLRLPSSASSSAPTATRTRDLLLRRHSRNVAGRRQTWPDVPSSCTDSSWLWPDVAPQLGSLAPREAHRNLLHRRGTGSSKTDTILRL